MSSQVKRSREEEKTNQNRNLVQVFIKSKLILCMPSAYFIKIASNNAIDSVKNDIKSYQMLLNGILYRFYAIDAIDYALHIE